jgi:serine protease Do
VNFPNKRPSPRFWVVVTSSALVAVSVAAVGAGAPERSSPAPLAVVSEAVQPEREPEHEREPETADAVEEVMRATVMIEDSGIYGSGLLIDPAHGVILTAHHVVKDMRSPQAKLPDGKKGAAKVIASDEKLDIAILRAPALVSKMAAPRFGDPTQLRAGEEVYAIGSPRKLAFTVSRGIVAYNGRPMEGARYVQLDMSINDVNSGGPVFNRRGEVIGIMSFILRRAQGLSFALPVAYAAERFPDQLPTIQAVA